MSKLTQDQVYQVQMARWDGWRQMAKKLPNHHVLAVELLRTSTDETAAVFTVVRNHEPVQYLVRADARGRLKPPIGRDPRDPRDQHGHGHGQDDCGPGQQPHHMMAMALEARAPGEGADANAIALGEPPPKEPPPPGITSLAGVMLPSAFDLGEVAASSTGK